MEFRYEREMLRPARQWLRSRGLLTRSEFATPWGVCDLVGCSFRSDSVAKRRELGQTKAIGSYIHVLVLSQVPEESEGATVTFDTLRRKLGWSNDESELARILSNLVRRRFLRKNRLGRYQRLNGWMPLQEAIVALELKLSRFRDALHQASAHLEFADESYVGLPMALSRAIANSARAHLLARLGVGLLGVSRRECEVLIPPRTHELAGTRPAQVHSVERFWRSYVRGSLA